MSRLRITHQVSTTCLRVRQILAHLRNGISIILQTSIDQSVLHLLHLSCDLTSLLICSLRCINRSRIALSSMRLLISSLRLLQLRQHLLQLRRLLRMILLQLLNLSLRVRDRLVESLTIHLPSVPHLLNNLADLSHSLRILSQCRILRQHISHLATSSCSVLQILSRLVMLRQRIRLALRLRCIIHRARHRLDLSCQLRIRLLQLRSQLMSCLRITHQVSTTRLRVRQILAQLVYSISIILQTSVDQGVLHLHHLVLKPQYLFVRCLRSLQSRRCVGSRLRLEHLFPGLFHLVDHVIQHVSLFGPASFAKLGALPTCISDRLIQCLQSNLARGCVVNHGCDPLHFLGILCEPRVSEGLHPVAHRLRRGVHLIRGVLLLLERGRVEFHL